MERKTVLRCLICSLLLCSAAAGAQTTFITDKITAELYSSTFQRGMLVGTVKTGAIVEIITTDGDFSKVRTQGGEEGWLHNQYLSGEKPAQVSYLQLLAKHEQLQEEMNRLRNQAGNSAEAEKEKLVLAKIRAELSEAKKTIAELQAQLQDKTAALEKAREQPAEAPAQALAVAAPAPETPGTPTPAQPQFDLNYPLGLKWLLAAMLLSVVLGGYLGYSWLDRKIARRHGGIRIR